MNIDPNKYILSDPPNEKMYNFTIPKSIKLVKKEKQHIFENVSFCLSPNVVIDHKQIKLIIESGGGKVNKCIFNLIFI